LKNKYPRMKHRLERKGLGGVLTEAGRKVGAQIILGGGKKEGLKKGKGWEKLVRA